MLTDVKFVYATSLSNMDLVLCQEYWAGANHGDYVEFVTELCQAYKITPNQLFQTLAQFRVYLLDVCCDGCRRPYLAQVPADMLYRRNNRLWVCEECQTLKAS